VSDLKISVLVRVDIDGRRLRLVVTGALTGANQRALHPVIERARTLTPAAEVRLDLSGSFLEPAAVELLRAGIDRQRRDRPAGTVELVLPEPAAVTDRTRQPVMVRSGGADRGGCARRDSW
jgi:hypothetical protein